MFMHVSRTNTTPLIAASLYPTTTCDRLLSADRHGTVITSNKKAKSKGNHHQTFINSVINQVEIESQQKNAQSCSRQSG